MNKAAFLDRDGVLNVDHGYVFRAEDWEWNGDALQAIHWLKDQGYLVVVITNQSGVGRGFYEESDVAALHDHVASHAPIDAFYYCPHAPDAGCNCRKPLPGMILRALRELDIQASESFLIGDKDSDVQAAEAAGVRGILYKGGSLLALVQRICAES